MEIRTLRRTVPGFSGRAPRESNGKIDKKDQNEVPNIFQEVPNAHPDSTQGAPEGSNSIPHILGLGLGPLPYFTCVSDCYLGLQELFTSENRTPQRTVPGY